MTGAGRRPTQAVMLSRDAVARQLDLPPAAPPEAFPPDLPEPDGRLGHTPWWWSTTIAEWLRSEPQIDRPRPAPRPGRHAVPEA